VLAMTLGIREEEGAETSGRESEGSPRAARFFSVFFSIVPVAPVRCGTQGC
jgi:hypothetical protein